MKSLPTLRRKILRSFTVLVGLYALLGFLLVIGVNIASKTTPTLIHVNYDSISAAAKMNEAWTALQFPAFSRAQAPEGWIHQFDQAIAFENGNISEPGEDRIAKSIQDEWTRAKPDLGHLDPARFDSMRKQLDELVAVNEKGMFGLAQENARLSEQVLYGAIAYFLLSIGLSLIVADRLSQRLSTPLKTIAEALHSRPSFSRRLRLPEPTTLELLILTTELRRLWEQLGQVEKVNVTAVLRQKNKLEAVLESVEDGLIVLGRDSAVSQCNERVAGLIGLSREQIQGYKWTDLPSSSTNYIKLRDTLRAGMPEGQQVELEWHGGIAFYSGRSRRIGPEGDEGGGTLYLLHDITEKKQREKFRSEFIDLLSHELKTPLQSLGTASELLCSQKAQFPEELRLLVDTVAEDVDRIRAVSQEFVQITQSQSKIMKIKLELVALNQLLPEWIKPFQVVARDRGVTIDLKQEGSEVIWADLDRVKFPWVISNILSNAVRFSPQGGVVTVYLTDRTGSVEMRVIDQGPGVPESEQNRMFEPFYQSAMPTHQGTRGLFGIGLTIAKEVVEAHDGRIEYHRALPTGSEFRILLPFPPLQSAFR